MPVKVVAAARIELHLDNHELLGRGGFRTAVPAEFETLHRIALHLVARKELTLTHTLTIVGARVRVDP